MKCYKFFCSLWTFFIISCLSGAFSQDFDIKKLISDVLNSVKTGLSSVDYDVQDVGGNLLSDVGNGVGQVLGGITNDLRYSRFPKNFFFGCSTSSYQIEGAWNEDGKGENMWDHYTHTRPEIIADRSNGDVACDSYHKYKEDVRMIKNIGFSVYRLSISWSRILPSGSGPNVNQAGIQYYENLIDELLANGIQPMVTLHHFDIPQPLVNIGGWLNPVVIDYYVELCRIIFQSLGPKVKLWITINEPITATIGYGSNDFPPMIDYHGVGEYLAAHNMLKAHAKAYHVYDTEFRKSQNGIIGITLPAEGEFPKTNSANDKAAAERGIQFILGWFAHPIYSKDGDYPPIMRQVIDENSRKEGRNASRLPIFTPAERESLRGSADFFGLNHYSSRLNTFGKSGPVPSWEYDAGVIKSVNPNWLSAASSWLKVVPEGFRQVLTFIKREYNNPPVFVTENGYSESGEIKDDDRINYYKGYLTQMLKAVYKDKCNVMGHIAWSLMDNFELLGGYTEKFGLYQVDFNSNNRTRTPKKSVKFFQQITRTKRIPF